MPIKFSNNASSVLSVAVDTDDTSFVLPSGQGSVFPTLSAGDYFYLTVGVPGALEIVKVTARSGDTLTVTRAQESTTARSFSVGAPVRLLITAGSLAELTPPDLSLASLGVGTAASGVSGEVRAGKITFGDNTSIESGFAGQVAFFATSTAPTGFLKANGAAISRTTYAALFSAIGTTFGTGDGSTTFNVPDLRGEFLRGWDDSRGVDTSRVFGSAQTHMFGSHQHFLVRNAYTNQYSQYGISLYTNNYIAGAGSGGYETYYLNGHTSEANVALSSPTGGAETRPRNVALLACIKF